MTAADLSPAEQLAAAIDRLVTERVTEQTARLVDTTAGIAPALMPRRKAAAYAGVSGSQIDRLWEDGRLEAVHDVGQGRLYTRESLDRLVAEGKQTIHDRHRAEVRRLAG